MTRKIFSLIMLIAVTGALFARTNNNKEAVVEQAKNTLMLSFGVIGTELSYERALNRYFSLSLNASYSTLLFMEALTASVQGKCYPFGKAFYLSVGLGYIYSYGSTDFMRDMLLDFLTSGWWQSQNDFNSKTQGFLIQPGFGWKIDIGKPNGFVLPINAGINLKVGSELPDIIPYARIGLGYSF